MSGHMNEISTVLNLRQCFRSWPGIKSSVQITHKTENSEYRKWYILEMEKEKNKQTEMPVKNLNKKKITITNSDFQKAICHSCRSTAATSRTPYRDKVGA